MKVKSESEVAHLCPTLATPWTVACQAPLSMGFSRQDYWSGLPFPLIFYYVDEEMVTLQSITLKKPGFNTEFDLIKVLGKEYDLLKKNLYSTW